jgi:hypothetical protein
MSPTSSTPATPTSASASSPACAASRVAPPEILRCTQELLDRVLFCAFCECRSLLPAESLKRAFEHREPYNPRPVWHSFRGPFRARDEGNAGWVP